MSTSRALDHTHTQTQRANDNDDHDDEQLLRAFTSIKPMRRRREFEISITSLTCRCDSTRLDSRPATARRATLVGLRWAANASGRRALGWPQLVARRPRERVARASCASGVAPAATNRLRRRRRRRKLGAAAAARETADQPVSASRRQATEDKEEKSHAESADDANEDHSSAPSEASGAPLDD